MQTNFSLSRQNKITTLLFVSFFTLLFSSTLLALGENNKFTPNSFRLPFFVFTTSSLYNQLAKISFKPILDDISSLWDSYSSPEKTLLDNSWKLQNSHRNTNYFSDKNLNLWKEEKKKPGDNLESSLYPYFGTNYSDCFSPSVLTQNNTIIVGMMFSQDDSDDEDDDGATSSSISGVDSYTPNMKYEYEDQDMNALLIERVQQEGFGANIILEAPVGPTIEDLIMRLTDEWSRNCYSRTIVVPLNLDNLHWVGLVIRFNKENQIDTIQYTDPQGNIMPKRVKEALLGLYGEDRTEIQYLKDRLKNIQVLLQTDATSCGPLTIENLIRVIHGRLVPEEVNEIMTRDIRRNHIELLERRRPDLSFNDRQTNNVRSFSYTQDSSRTFLRPVDKEELSEDDKSVIKEIIALCRRIIISCEVNPELLDPKKLDPMFHRYFILELSKVPEYWPSKYKSPEIFYVQRIPEEKIRVGARSYVHLYEDLNKIFELTAKIPWNIKNNPKYHMIPWRHLDYMREVFVGNTGFVKETRDILNIAVIDFIQDREKGLAALQNGFESILRTQSSENVSVLFKQLSGFYYDSLIYRDIHDRLSILVRESNGAQSLLWKLALLRTMQVAGEHCKSLAWVSSDPELSIPRKLLLEEGRDPLSHVRITQLSRFMSFLNDPMKDGFLKELIEECKAFLERTKEVLEEQEKLRVGVASTTDLWTRLKERSLDKPGSDPSSLEWSRLKTVLQVFKRPTLSGRSIPHNTDATIEKVVDLLLPLPSYSQQTEDFFEQRKSLEKQILRNPGKDVKKFKENLTNHGIFLPEDENFEELFASIVALQDKKTEARRNWKRFIMEKSDQSQLQRKYISELEQLLDNTSDFANFTELLQQHEVTTCSDVGLLELELSCLWDELRICYRQYRDRLKRLEEESLELQNRILRVSEDEIKRFEDVQEKISVIKRKRAELRNKLKNVVLIPSDSPYSLIQEEYGKFRSEVEKIIEAKVTDSYHQDNPGILEVVFSELSGLSIEGVHAKQARRIRNIREVNNLINILRELFGIRHTVTTEIEQGPWTALARSPEGQKDIKKGILDGHQRFTPYITQQRVEVILKESPLHLYAAEYLVGVICECIIKELDKYPEFNGRLSRLDVVRNFFAHPEATYRHPLIMQDNTTYIDNHVATVAQQVAQLAINVQCVIEAILKDAIP